MKRDGARLISLVSSDKIKSNGHKLKHKRLSLKIKKRFFTIWVTEHWCKLLREAVESSSLQIF